MGLIIYTYDSWQTFFEVVVIDVDLHTWEDEVVDLIL
jgi:hypothetical protein